MSHKYIVYKKGGKKSASNYRLVSLTSVACKSMERLVRHKIMNHVDINQLLVDNQYGLDQWTELLDKGNYIDVTYIDFSKAFDTVPDKRLINKLEAHGIKGQLLKWINDFLSNRRQRVSVNRSLSHWLDLLSGITQREVCWGLFSSSFI